MGIVSNAVSPHNRDDPALYLPGLHRAEPSAVAGTGAGIAEDEIFPLRQRQRVGRAVLIGRGRLVDIGLGHNTAVDDKTVCRRHLHGVAAASPSVWFPGWMEFEQQHPIQAQRVYLSLGDKEEHTKNTVMAAVGDNIRTLHSRLAERGTDCTLEWNSGGHFKDADLRTAKAFRWVMEESR